MTAFPDSEILQLDSFDAAFPVEPGHEAAALRLFSTLFVETDGAFPSAGTLIRKARNYRGDVYALKRGRAGDPVFYEEYRTHCSVACLRGFPDVFGYGTSGDDAFIVMEWIDGATLRSVITASTPDATAQSGPHRHNGATLPLASVAKLGRDMCRLVEQANEAKAGFVHRDISPRNIMLRTDTSSVEEQLQTGAFDICLIDFGSSTCVEDDPSFTKLSGVYRYGTPDYAPPEMLTEDVDVPGADRASESIDVYALCSVLFELYTGHTPYRLAEQVEGSPYRIKTEQPVPVITPRDEDGGALARIIESGLAPEQAGRPTRAQLERALDNWLNDPHAQSPGTLSTRKRAPHSMWQPDYQGRLLSRRRLIAGGIVLAAAAVSGALVTTKLLNQAAQPHADLSSLPTTDTPYSGTPLYKVNDSEHPGWALADDAGQIRCKPQTSREIGRLSEGMVSCYSDLAQRYGFIAPNANGDYAWRVLPQFAAVGDFSEGLAAAEDPASRLWGFIDAQGAWIIAPHYKAARAFSGGLAAVSPDDGSGLWGAVDSQGAWRVEPSFASLGSFSAEGFAAAQAPAAHARAYCWGVVQADGTWACDPTFFQMRRFSDGCAPAQAQKGGAWGYADARGSWAIEPTYLDARPFSENAAAVQDKETQLWFLIDSTGKPLDGARPAFWKLGELVDGLAPAQASAKDDTVTFSTGETAQGTQMRYGYVDKHGNWHMKRLTALADTAIGAPAI